MTACPAVDDTALTQHERPPGGALSVTLHSLYLLTGLSIQGTPPATADNSVHVLVEAFTGDVLRPLNDSIMVGLAISYYP